MQAIDTLHNSCNDAKFYKQDTLLCVLTPQMQCQVATPLPSTPCQVELLYTVPSTPDRSKKGPTFTQSHRFLRYPDRRQPNHRSPNRRA